jgi:ABC-type glycerol-3-phosphate transport system substrate-binding protein
MFKKVVSIVMIIALSLSLLAGCAKKEEATSNPSEDSAVATPATEEVETPEEVETTEEEEPAKEVTLTLWQQSAYKTETSTKLEEEFLAANPNIKLNIVETADFSTSALLSAIAAGNAPSVFSAGYPTTMAYIYQNAVYPIDEFIAETPDFANFDQAQVDTFLVNGKHYALPIGKYVMGFMYNKKLFAEAGISAPPTTWDEFYDACVKLTKPEIGQYGFGLDGTQWASWHFEQWVWQAGGDLSVRNADGTATLTLDDPAVKIAADFYRKLKDDKLIQPDANMQLDAIAKDFAMGKSGMVVAGLQNWQLNNMITLGAKAEDIGFFANPAGPSGDAYCQMGGDVSFITTTKDKDVAEAAWKFLMFMNSREAYDLQYKERAANGEMGAEIIPRTDIKLSDYGPVNEELQAIVDASAPISRDEYYAKGAVGAVIDDAIAKWFADSSLDVEAVMKEAQEAIEAKELIDFNNAVLAAQ